MKAVRVEFTPECTKTSGSTYTRALVDSGQLVWIELAADTPDDGRPDEVDDDHGEAPTI